MPREAARLWLLVEDIRCERLQDITEEDALKEGTVYFINHCNPKLLKGKSVISTIFQNFEFMWDKINANRKDKDGNILPYAWKDNPYVYPIDYSLFFQGRGEYE